MAELQDTAGKPLDEVKAEANTAFAAAMADEHDEPSAPPKRQPREPEAAPKRRSRPPKAERARTSPKAASAAPVSDDDRAQAVKGLVQIASGLTLLGSRATAKPVRDDKGRVVGREDNAALKADAITLASAADDIAGACVDVAQKDARFAALIDKIANVGPYGALITVAFGVGSQIVRNHRPGAKLPGTVDPGELIAAAEQQPEAA